MADIGKETLGTLKFGDIIALTTLSSGITTPSNLTAGGFIDDTVYSEELVAGVRMPPNPRECRFVVYPAGVHTEETALLSSVAQQSRDPASRVDNTDLHERAAIEANHNLIERNRLIGTSVRYGVPIFLQHVNSSKALATAHDQGPEPGSVALRLKRAGAVGMSASARLQPAFASHTEGSVIRSGHAVVVNFIQQRVGLVVSKARSAEHSADEEIALHPHVSKRSIVCAKTRPSRLKLLKLRSFADPVSSSVGNQLIHGCDAVRLIFNGTQEELSVETTAASDPGSAPAIFREGPLMGTAPNSMCWWVLEPTDMDAGCAPAKFGEHKVL